VRHPWTSQGLNEWGRLKDDAAAGDMG